VWGLNNVDGSGKRGTISNLGKKMWGLNEKISSEVDQRWVRTERKGQCREGNAYFRKTKVGS